jgi:hypothetical protein
VKSSNISVLTHGSTYSDDLAIHYILTLTGKKFKITTMTGFFFLNFKTNKNKQRKGIPITFAMHLM